MLKRFLLIFFVLLSLPVVFANNVSYNQIINQGVTVDSPEGVLHIYWPDTVVENENFVVSAIFFPQTDFPQLNFTLMANSILFDPVVSEGDNPNKITYTRADWTPILQTDTLLDFSFFVDDVLVHQQFLPVNVTKPEIERVYTAKKSSLPNGLDIQEQETLRQLLRENNFLFTSKEFTSLQTTANKSITLEKIVSTDVYHLPKGNVLRTTVNITITPKEDLAFVDIIEHVPKLFSLFASELSYSTTPTVLKDDPILMWHLENVTTPVTVSFTKDGNETITGETTLLAQTSQGQIKGRFHVDSIVLLLLILLVVAIIMYFLRFELKTKH